MRPLAARASDLLCAGEALVDFLPEEAARMRDVARWRRCPGGSPANVAIGAARLGARAAFAGVVGADEFGAFLAQALEAEGVDVAALRRTAEARTGIIFVSLDASGERSFTDYRKPSAELLLGRQDVERIDLERYRVVHLGASSLLREEAAEAGLALLERARAAGCVTSCDPNLRLGFWDDTARLQRLLRSLLPRADVVKLAADETAFCTGEAGPAEAARALAARGTALAVITLGERGALARFRGETLEVPAPPVHAVDSTGAGDGFMAGLLAGLCRAFRRGEPLSTLGREEILEALALGCRVGSSVAERLGAVDGLPRLAILGAPGRGGQTPP